jgi:flagellar basal body-associated protein FliL
MLVLILSVVVLLVIGGCFCVFWAARGDAPRWARGAAKATLLGSELARSASRNSRSQQSGGDG